THDGAEEDERSGAPFAGEVLRREARGDLGDELATVAVLAVDVVDAGGATAGDDVALDAGEQLGERKVIACGGEDSRAEAEVAGKDRGVGCCAAEAPDAGIALGDDVLNGVADDEELRVLIRHRRELPPVPPRRAL